MTWNKLVDRLQGRRKPPIHPDDMRTLLHSNHVRFTTNSDIDVVVAKYRDFFGSVAANVRSMSWQLLLLDHISGSKYAKVDWPREHFEALAKSLVEFSKCETVNLEGLNIRMEDAHILAPALLQMHALTKVILCDDRPFRVENDRSDMAALLYIKQALIEKGVEVPSLSQFDT